MRKITEVGGAEVAHRVMFEVTLDALEVNWLGLLHNPGSHKRRGTLCDVD